MLQTLADDSIQVRFDQSGATRTDPGLSTAYPKATSAAWAAQSWSPSAKHSLNSVFVTVASVSVMAIVNPANQAVPGICRWLLSSAV